MDNKRRGARKNTKPIFMIYNFLKKHTKVEIWLLNDNDTRLQGVIVGMDEFMNLTLEKCIEINTRKGTEKKLGLMVLKRDNICLIHCLEDETFESRAY